MDSTPPKKLKKSPLTDEDRHKRFLATAKDVDAEEDLSAFDRAFSKVTAKPNPKD